MSLHRCFKCDQIASTWSVNDDNETWWYCSLCGFAVQEDESKEAECDVCTNYFNGMLYLLGSEGNFYWCPTCGKRIDD